MGTLPFGSDEPFTYLYNGTKRPDPAEGMGSVGAVADLMSIPLQRFPEPQSVADIGGDQARLLNLIKMMQGTGQSEGRAPNASDAQSSGGSNLTGEGVDENFVYQPSPRSPIDVSWLPPVLRGYATYYNLVGNKTASGQPFNPDSNNAAMFRPGQIRLGDVVTVLRQGTPNSVTVTVNDRGPSLRGPDGKAVVPVQPDPNNVIDLTPRAFEALGPRKLGKIPVVVVPHPQPLGRQYGR